MPSDFPFTELVAELMEDHDVALDLADGLLESSPDCASATSLAVGAIDEQHGMAMP